MALPTEEQAKRNPILKLVRELRKKTHGICDVGAGPWGFGVNTLSLSKIHVCVCLNPDPYNVPLPPEVKRYALTLQTSCDDPDGFLDTKVLSTEDLQQLSKDQDIVTRFMAKTLLEMSANPVIASVQENIDAFDELFDMGEQGHDERITPEEAKHLEDLRWYETKTPEEIVDFFLGEGKLCMPMEQFREAAEAILSHPVTAETPDDCREELLKERQRVWRLNKDLEFSLMTRMQYFMDGAGHCSDTPLSQKLEVCPTLSCIAKNMSLREDDSALFKESRRCLHSLIDHAAYLSAHGGEERLPALRDFVCQFASFWSEDPSAESSAKEAAHFGALFDKAVFDTQNGGKVPVLGDRRKINVLTGLENYIVKKAQQFQVIDQEALDSGFAACEAVAASLRQTWREAALDPEPTAQYLDKHISQLHGHMPLAF